MAEDMHAHKAHAKKQCERDDDNTKNDMVIREKYKKTNKGPNKKIDTYSKTNKKSNYKQMNLHNQSYSPCTYSANPVTACEG